MSFIIQLYRFSGNKKIACLILKYLYLSGLWDNLSAQIFIVKCIGTVFCWVGLQKNKEIFDLSIFV